MPNPVKAFEAALQRQKTAAIPRGLVQQEALKAMKKVQPRPNALAPRRAQTVKALAGALIQLPVFMNYLKQYTAEYGRFDGHTLPDLLGDIMWSYRDGWEIPDNDEWAELSSDPVLRSVIQKAVEKWDSDQAPPQLSGVDLIDFGTVESLVTRLERSIQRVKRDHSQSRSVDLSEAQALVKQIDSALRG